MVAMLCSGVRYADEGLGSILEGLAGGNCSRWLQDKKKVKNTKARREEKIIFMITEKLNN